MDGWLSIFTALIEFIPAIGEKRRHEQDYVDTTLEALTDAYYETERYFAFINEGGVENRERQYQIAQKWDHLSNLIRKYDANLASRLSLKSRFWREGAAWSPEQVKEANIGLQKIRSDGRVLLLMKKQKD